MDRNPSEKHQDTRYQSKSKVFYTLIHHTPEWAFIAKGFEPIASGQAKLPEIFATIQECMARFYPHDPNANTLLLEQFIGFLPGKEQDEWEKEIFPALAKLILKTPELFPNDIDIPLLVQGSQEKVRLSREQCTCLLAHMFMCTTLDQKSRNIPKPYNFSKLFTLEDQKQAANNIVRAQKIRCLYSYFQQVLKKEKQEETFVVFTRMVYEESRLGGCDAFAWAACKSGLLQMEIRAKGGIEEAKGCLEIDFANKYLGGGVLGNGMVQEEIMLMTSPEGLVGILFCESMREEEAILIQGAATMSEYQGYAKGFKWNGKKEEKYEITKSNIVDRNIIAIDALDLRDERIPTQFSTDLLLRELNKAYVGFSGVPELDEEIKRKPIATGRWGCGIFAGNVHLKFILQWIAASRAGRAMIFYSFGKQGLENIEKIVKFYEGKDVGELVKDVLECAKNVRKANDSKFDLFSALMKLKSIKGDKEVFDKNIDCDEI